MTLARLKKFPLSDPRATAADGARIRGTEAQDALRASRVPTWRRHRVALDLGGGALVTVWLR